MIMKNLKRIWKVPTLIRLTGLICLAIFILGCSAEDTTLLENETVHFKDKTLEAKLAKATTWQEQVEILEQKMRRFHNFQVAQAQGYTLLMGPPGNEYVPYMGYHYANPDFIDGEFNLLEPEILVYYPDEDGNMIFGAAEYLVPIDGFNPPNGCQMDPTSVAPEGFIGDSDHWHPVCGAGGWTLHAWVGTENFEGVFAALNPAVPETPANQ